MAYTRIAFDSASKELSKIIIEGSGLGKDAWEIASALELIVSNALVLSESTLLKNYGEQGTFDYLDVVQSYIKKYFKDINYRD